MNHDVGHGSYGTAGAQAESSRKNIFWFFACLARWGRGDLALFGGIMMHDDGHQSSYPLSLQYWVGSGKFCDIFVAPHLILDNDGMHRLPM